MTVSEDLMDVDEPGCFGASSTRASSPTCSLSVMRVSTATAGYERRIQRRRSTLSVDSRIKNAKLRKIIDDDDEDVFQVSEKSSHCNSTSSILPNGLPVSTNIIDPEEVDSQVAASVCTNLEGSPALSKDSTQTTPSLLPLPLDPDQDPGPSTLKTSRDSVRVKDSRRTKRLRATNASRRPVLLCPEEGCSFITTSKSWLGRHRNSVHGSASVAPASESAEAGSSSLPQPKAATAAAKHECSPCSKQFTSSEALQRHIRRAHDAKLYKCRDCGKQFREKYLWVRHEAVHAEISAKPFRCECCESRFVTQRSLNVHCRNQHGFNLELRSQSQAATSEHAGATSSRVMKRADSPLHPCPQCRSAFVHAVSLTRHMVNAHASLECVECQLTFGKRHQLLRHRRKVHKQLTTQQPASQGLVAKKAPPPVTASSPTVPQSQPILSPSQRNVSQPVASQISQGATASTTGLKLLASYGCDNDSDDGDDDNGNEVPVEATPIEVDSVHSPGADRLPSTSQPLHPTGAPAAPLPVNPHVAPSIRDSVPTTTSYEPIIAAEGIPDWSSLDVDSFAEPNFMDTTSFDQTAYPQSFGNPLANSTQIAPVAQVTAPSVIDKQTSADVSGVSTTSSVWDTASMLEDIRRLRSVVDIPTTQDATYDDNTSVISGLPEPEAICSAAGMSVNLVSLTPHDPSTSVTQAPPTLADFYDVPPPNVDSAAMTLLHGYQQYEPVDNFPSDDFERTPVTRVNVSLPNSRRVNDSVKSTKHDIDWGWIHETQPVGASPSDDFEQTPVPPVNVSLPNNRSVNDTIFTTTHDGDWINETHEALVELEAMSADASAMIDYFGGESPSSDSD